MISAPDFNKKQIVIVMIRFGDKLSFSNDNIVVKDKDGKTKHKSSCFKLFLLIVVGEITITSGLLRRAKKYGFSICMMTYSCKIYQMLNNMGEGNTILRKKQYSYEGLDLGKHIINNKILSQRNMMLKKRATLLFDDYLIEILDKYSKSVLKAETLSEIMGYEGAAAKLYFECIFNNVPWQGRKPRIKCDYVNAVLDIGYTLLFSFVEAIVNSFGFDIYQGILHRCYYMRKSLICDLIEPMRPLIDYTIRKAINLGRITEKDFNNYKGRWVLKYEENAKYMEMLLEPIVHRKDDIFLFLQKYYRAFMKNLDPADFPVFEV